MSRILSSDPVTREVVLWHEGHHGDVGVESRQDVEDILHTNQENRKTRRGYKHGNYHHVASIPSVIVEQLMREGIWGDTKAFLKWLDEHEEWKSHPGKLA